MEKACIVTLRYNNSFFVVISEFNVDFGLF